MLLIDKGIFFFTYEVFKSFFNFISKSIATNDAHITAFDLVCDIIKKIASPYRLILISRMFTINIFVLQHNE